MPGRVEKGIERPRNVSMLNRVYYVKLETYQLNMIPERAWRTLCIKAIRKLLVEDTSVIEVSGGSPL